MGEALAWVGQIAEWFGQFIPRWKILDSRSGAVKFQTLRVRDLLRARWDTSCKTTALGPGLHFYWPAVTEIRAWVVARQNLDLVSQTVTTADGKVIVVGGILEFRLIDPLKLVGDSWNPDNTIRGRAAGVLHRICADGTWADLQRDQASGALVQRLRRALHRRLKPLGVKVIAVEFSDFAPTRVLRLVQTTSSDTY